MLPFLIRTIVLIAAGVALLRLWRVTASHSRLVGYLVAGGILVRVALGVPLFWISYLELPYGRSLQLGNGFWFFATDATGYFSRAVHATAAGPMGILTMERTLPSLFYNQVLGVFVWLVGSVASAGLLLNLFAYVTTAALIVVWARRYSVPLSLVAIPIVAVSYSPSWILWSSQPLKDAFFCFLSILFAFTVDRWIREWRSPQLRPWRIASVGILLAILIYGVASVRWYYAFVALVVAIYPVLSAVFARTNARQRAAAAAAGVALLFVMSRQIIAGAGPYLPDPMQDVLRFRSKQSVTVIVETVELARRNLDTFVSSGTRIRAGKALEKKPLSEVPAKTATAPPAQTATVPAQTATVPAQTATVPAQTAAVPAQTATVPAQTATAPAKTVTVPAKPAVVPAKPATVPAKPATAPAKTATVPAKPAVVAAKPAVVPAKTATVPAKPAVVPAKPATVPAKTATVPAKPAAVPAQTATVPAQTATVSAKPAAVPAKPAAVPAPKPSVLAQSEEVERPVSDVPQTVKDRLIAGFAAMVLPHFVAESLGLISVGEGRGFWWFADFDTILFDVFLLLAVAIFFRRFRRAWRDPFAFYLVALSVVLAGALAYTISNFGALFRHRSMVLSLVVLLPLAAYRAASRKSGTAETAEPVPDHLSSGVPVPSADV